MNDDYERTLRMLETKLRASLNDFPRDEGEPSAPEPVTPRPPLSPLTPAAAALLRRAQDAAPTAEPAALLETALAHLVSAQAGAQGRHRPDPVLLARLAAFDFSTLRTPFTLNEIASAVGEDPKSRRLGPALRALGYVKRATRRDNQAGNYWERKKLGPGFVNHLLSFTGLPGAHTAAELYAQGVAQLDEPWREALLSAGLEQLKAALLESAELRLVSLIVQEGAPMRYSLGG